MQQNFDSVAGQTARLPAASSNKERSWLRRYAILIAALLTTTPLGAKQAPTVSQARSPLPTMDKKAEVKDPITSARVAALAKRFGAIAKTQRPHLMAQQQLSNYATQELTGQTEEFLNRWGTAQIKFSGDEKFKRFQGSAGLLYPFELLEKQRISFTQLMLQYADGSATVNLGIGQRYWVDKWLLGGNLFFDWNTKHSHFRTSLGGEAKTDYLLLTGNGYFPLSKWKKVDSKSEKAAAGFDLIAQSYLPEYPQLGGKLSFEQYFGNEITLLGKDKAQKDPFALGIGVDYTPFPLLTVGADFRLGKKKKNSTKLNLQLQYALSTPWKHQLESERVANMRTLSFTQFDFVQRNNQIVLKREARGQSQSGQGWLSINAPSSLTIFKGGSNVELPYTVSSPAGYSVAMDVKIKFEGDKEFKEAGGNITSSSKHSHDGTITITSPSDTSSKTEEADKKFSIKVIASIMAGEQEVKKVSPVELAFTLSGKAAPATIQMDESESELSGTPGEEVIVKISMGGEAKEVSDVLFSWRGNNCKDEQKKAKQSNNTYAIQAPKQAGRYALFAVALDKKGAPVSEILSIPIVLMGENDSIIILDEPFLLGKLGKDKSLTTTIEVLTKANKDSYDFKFDRGTIKDVTPKAAAADPTKADKQVYDLVITMPKDAGDYNVICDLYKKATDGTLETKVSASATIFVKVQKEDDGGETKPPANGTIGLAFTPKALPDGKSEEELSKANSRLVLNVTPATDMLEKDYKLSIKNDDQYTAFTSTDGGTIALEKAEGKGAQKIALTGKLPKAAAEDKVYTLTVVAELKKETTEGGVTEYTASSKSELGTGTVKITVKAKKDGGEVVKPKPVEKGTIGLAFTPKALPDGKSEEKLTKEDKKLVLNVTPATDMLEKDYKLSIKNDDQYTAFTATDGGTIALEKAEGKGAQQIALVGKLPKAAAGNKEYTLTVVADLKVPGEAKTTSWTETVVINVKKDEPVKAAKEITSVVVTTDPRDGKVGDELKVDIEVTVPEDQKDQYTITLSGDLGDKLNQKTFTGNKTKSFKTKGTPDTQKADSKITCTVALDGDAGVTKTETATVNIAAKD